MEFQCRGKKEDFYIIALWVHILLLFINMILCISSLVWCYKGRAVSNLLKTIQAVSKHDIVPNLMGKHEGTGENILFE